MRVTSEIKATIRRKILEKYAKRTEELQKSRNKAKERVDKLTKEACEKFWNAVKYVIEDANGRIAALQKRLDLYETKERLPIELMITKNYRDERCISAKRDSDLVVVSADMNLKEEIDKNRKFERNIDEKIEEIIASAQLGSKWPEIQKMIDEMDI